MGNIFLANKILSTISMPYYDISDVMAGPINALKKWLVMAVICVIAFICVVVIVMYIDYKMKHKKYDGTISKSVKDEVGKYNLDTIDNYEDTKKKLQIERREIEINKEIKEKDTDFSIVKFKDDVCKTFLNMQKYWSEGNLDKLRDIETDELYEQHRIILEKFENNHQKNIREEVSIEGCFLYDFSRDQDSEDIIVDYIVKMKDYIVGEGENVSNNKIKLQTYLYRTTFVRTLGTKTNENFEPGKNVRCPNCGAEVKVSVSEYCPYCNSLIISKEYGWVISNIEKTIIKDSQIKN